MDNVTHTLISVLVGETVHRSLPPSAVLSDRARRTVAITVMAVGGNLPDADVAYTTWAGTALDYLLHHRGHTHTVIGSLGLSLLLFLAVRLWWWRRKVVPRPADTWFLVGVSVLGPLLHIGLDFTNSYGVHPFWPLDNHWYYGDAVFIVEPLLWACAAVLLFVLPGRVGRALIAVVLLAGLGLSWLSGFVPLGFAAALTGVTVALALLGRFAPPRTALAGGIAAWLVLTGTFVATSAAAENRFENLLADRFPDARTLDVVLTPMPANPVCREVLAVQKTTDRYVVRRAFHSLAPGLITADRCARLFPMEGDTTAKLTPVDRPSTDEVAWRGEAAMPADLIGRLATEHCAVEALMRFARAPAATQTADGWIVGDLRYDREPGLGMAEVSSGEACPRFWAPWTPPREDLLGE